MLTDRYNRTHNYLRIALTDSCNLRCGYCRPGTELSCRNNYSGMMSVEEIVSLAGYFIELGIQKIRLTGGEPLMRNDFPDILHELRNSIGSSIELGLSTNGILIHRYIREIREAKMESVNVSLDTLMPERFLKITQRNYFHRVMSNIHLLLQNNIRVKVNVVIMKNFNDDELVDLVRWTRDFPLDVRFIEFMPFQGNQWGKEKLVPMEMMMQSIKAHFDIQRIETVKENATAETFKVPGFEGTFSFIPTMSAPFCGSCSRLRITADGRMKNCLFSQGEIDLLSIMRSGCDIRSFIRQHVMEKKEKWGGHRLFEEVTPRSMISIGG